MSESKLQCPRIARNLHDMDGRWGQSLQMYYYYYYYYIIIIIIIIIITLIVLELFQSKASSPVAP